ncbi:MAG: DNA polymerase III subunit delta, partial [Comamonadaceae bacterium]
MATLDVDRFIDLMRSINGPLAPLYVLMGDEPLLVAEAGDALRAAGVRLGYADRQTLVMDARSDWSAVLAETQSVSLFGDRRLIEIKLASGKPGKTGADTLMRLADQAAGSTDPEILLAIHLPRLDRAARESKWAQALLKSATVVDIAPIERARL